MHYVFIFLIGLISFTGASTVSCRQPDSLAVQREKNPAPQRRKYVPNPHVDPAVWEQLAPYFLPEHSRKKDELDKIFTKRSHALESFEEIFKAGFQIRKRPDDKVIVAWHPKIKKHLLKMYMDDSPHGEADIWKRRVEGANTAREAITKHGYNHILKAPRKWIYPLPPSDEPLNNNGVPRKHFILVVEDMKVLKKKKNYTLYRKKITTEQLDAIHHLITTYGMIDSVYPFNIPFCKDGKIAFVDTEWVNRDEPVPLEKLKKYLSPEMQTHWDDLSHHYGSKQ